MRLIVQVLPLAAGPADSLAARGRVGLAPPKPNRFTIPVEPNYTFERIWSLVEARYTRNYLTPAQAANFTIKKIQDIYDCDLDLGDTVGAIFGSEKDQEKIMIQVIQAVIDRDISVLPTSNLRPKLAQKRLLEVQNSGASKRRRIEEQRYGTPIENLNPDTPVQSSERDLRTEPTGELTNGDNTQDPAGRRRSRSASSVVFIQDSQVDVANQGNPFFEESPKSESPQPRRLSQQSIPESSVEHLANLMPETNGTVASNSRDQFLKPTLPASRLKDNPPTSGQPAPQSSKSGESLLSEDEDDDSDHMDGGDGVADEMAVESQEPLGFAETNSTPRPPANPYASNASTPEALDRAPLPQSRRGHLESEDVYDRIVSPDEERLFRGRNKRIKTYTNAFSRSKNIAKQNGKPKSHLNGARVHGSTESSSGVIGQRAGQLSQRAEAGSLQKSPNGHSVSVSRLVSLVEDKQRRGSIDDNHNPPQTPRTPTTERSVASLALPSNPQITDTPEKPSALKKPSKSSYKMASPAGKQRVVGKKSTAEQRKKWTENRRASRAKLAAKRKEKEEGDKRREASILRQSKANEFRKRAAAIIQRSSEEVHEAEQQRVQRERRRLEDEDRARSRDVSVQPSQDGGAHGRNLSAMLPSTPLPNGRAIHSSSGGETRESSVRSSNQDIESIRSRSGGALNLGRKRKSCDYCYLRSRKCDWGEPCSFCVSSQVVCVNTSGATSTPLPPTKLPATSAVKRQSTLPFPQDKGKGKVIDTPSPSESWLDPRPTPSSSCHDHPANWSPKTAKAASKTASVSQKAHTQDKELVAGSIHVASILESEQPAVETIESTSQSNHQGTKSGPSKAPRKGSNVHPNGQETPQENGQAHSPPASTTNATSSARESIPHALKPLEQDSSTVTPAKDVIETSESGPSGLRSSSRRSVSFSKDIETSEKTTHPIFKPPSAQGILKNSSFRSRAIDNPPSRLTNLLSSQEQPPEATPSRDPRPKKTIAPINSDASRTPSQDGATKASARPALKRQSLSHIAIPARAVKLADVRAQQERIATRRTSSSSGEETKTIPALAKKTRERSPSATAQPMLADEAFKRTDIANSRPAANAKLEATPKSTVSTLKPKRAASTMIQEPLPQENGQKIKTAQEPVQGGLFLTRSDQAIQSTVLLFQTTPLSKAKIVQSTNALRRLRGQQHIKQEHADVDTIAAPVKEVHPLPPKAKPIPLPQKTVRPSPARVEASEERQILLEMQAAERRKSVKSADSEVPEARKPVTTDISDEVDPPGPGIAKTTISAPKGETTATKSTSEDSESDSDSNTSDDDEPLASNISKKVPDATTTSVLESGSPKPSDAIPAATPQNPAESDSDESDLLDNVKTPVYESHPKVVNPESTQSGTQESDVESDPESEDEPESEPNAEEEARKSVEASPRAVRAPARFVSHTSDDSSESDDDSEDEGTGEEEASKKAPAEASAPANEDVDMDSSDAESTEDEDEELLVPLANSPSKANEDVEMADAPPSSPPELPTQAAQATRSQSTSSESSSTSTSASDASTPVPSRAGSSSAGAKSPAALPSSIELGSPTTTLAAKSPISTTAVPPPPRRPGVNPRARVSASRFPTISQQLATARATPKPAPKAFNPATVNLKKLGTGKGGFGVGILDDDSEDSSESSSDSDSSSESEDAPTVLRKPANFFGRLKALNM